MILTYGLDPFSGLRSKVLGIIANRGRSPRTINLYRSYAYSLAEWLVTIARLLDRNPVAAVARRQESSDVREVRRSLIVEEAYRLLGVCGLRRLFYSTQLWTGLRVSEVTLLEWRDLVIDGDQPCIRLRAATTKARRADDLPLYPDLAAALAEAKPPFAKSTDRVFQNKPSLKTFKYDLKRAGIDVEDDQGRTVDRHALRTTFISWLGLYGVDARAQIMLARHVPQGVTLKHYQDFSILDLWAEIGKLPPIRTEAVAKAAQATGTEDRQALASEGVVLPVVQQPGRKGVNLAASGRIGATGRHKQEARKPPKKQGLRAAKAVSAQASNVEVTRSGVARTRITRERKRDRMPGECTCMKRAGVIAIAFCASALGGCGTGVVTDFPNRLIGAEGQRFVLEDLKTIADDLDLDDEEKRQAFRDLGIEDEELIEALLTL